MSMMRILLAALLLLLPGLAHAQSDETQWDVAQQDVAQQDGAPSERILHFLSDVHVEKNGTLDVTETIRVRSTGEEIKRGIQRDFPTTYTTTLGQKTRTTFDPVSVSRDGVEEPYERISMSNGVRLRIGRAEAMLPPGEHTYVIRYKTTRQISYRDGYDEVYWNATGNGWTFPIDSAEARITLPSAVKFGNRAAYTGSQGSTDRNAQVVEERPGYIVFRTTEPLGREQGLTVAAAIPKGVLDAPGAGARLGWWLEEWGALVAGLAALLALVVYYAVAWARAGRNPRAGTVVPIFTPADGLTPAAMRYIAKMKFDNRAFSAAIVDLGVRGKLHMSQAEGGWLSKGVTTLSRKDRGKDLPKPEAKMLDRLFSRGETITLQQENHATLRMASSYLESGLESAYKGKLFRDNRGWATRGLLGIPFAMLLISIFAVFVSGGTEVALQVMAVIGVVLCGFTWWLRWKTRKVRGGMAILIWIALALIGGTGGMMAVGTFMSGLVLGAWPILLPLLVLPVAISAYWWMYAPTREGREVMDRIAGFKQYLGIAEEERLDRMHPPEKTPELFERYLPYAIALDVENRWAKRFAGVLAAAAASGAAAQTATWYSGSSNLWDDPDRFVGTVGSSLASTVSSASSSPSSSSSSSSGGSSGGGSSGGGGGGGGGSGW